MKKYKVESRKNYTEDFDNWAGDYLEAESDEEAVELYKAWLVENGEDPDNVEEYEYKVDEY